MMKSYLITLICIYFSEGYALSLSANHFELKVGESKSLALQKPIWVESKKVLSAKVQNSVLVVTAVAAGFSEVSVGSKKYTFSVVSPLQSRTSVDLDDFLKNSLSLKVKRQNEKIMVTGDLLFFKDWLNLGEHCLANNCRYEFNPKMTQALFSGVRPFIKAELKKRNLPEVSISRSPPWSLLIPKSAKDDVRLRKFADAFGLIIEEDHSLLESKKMIRIQLVMAEVSRKKFNQLGVNWPSEATIWQAQKGWVADESASLKLKALEENGEATTLASPELIGISGEETEFFAGGEFPIRIINDQSKTVQWKKYGVILKFKPLADSSERMRLNISAEISSLDKVSVDGVPGLITHRIDSHFELLKSQMVLLSGLVRNDRTGNHMGLPGLKDIPILGALFSSRNFTESESELVVLVKPEIIETTY